MLSTDGNSMKWTLKLAVLAAVALAGCDRRESEPSPLPTPTKQNAQAAVGIGKSFDDFQNSIPLLMPVEYKSETPMADGTPQVYLQSGGWEAMFRGPKQNLTSVTLDNVYAPVKDVISLEVFARALRVVQVASDAPDISEIGPWISDHLSTGAVRKFGNVKVFLSRVRPVPGTDDVGFSIDIVDKDSSFVQINDKTRSQ